MSLRFDASHFRYFLFASWAAAVAVMAIILYSVFAENLAMGAVTGILSAVALLIALPELYLVYRKGDGLDGWRLHTVFTLVSLALLSLAVCTWIQTGHAFADRDVFLGVANMSMLVVLVWGIYTAVNLAAFMLAFRGASGDIPEEEQEEVPYEDYEPSPAGTPSAEPELDGYRANMDIILSDIERFSSDGGDRTGIAVREDRGGN